jgi:uncharacterized protein YndB with AHSA1/START domain
MTTTSKNQVEPILRKTVQVNAPQAHAFAVFTERFSDWWPLETHHIGTQPAQTAILEPRMGGRWFEHAADGTECDWGRVLLWDPPYRIVLSWDISAEWKHQPNLGTEVEIQFIAEGPDTTRVELEHRHLDRYGSKAETMRTMFDSESGWTGLLRRFADAAAKTR